MTGTTKPSGVSTAIPIWKYFFRIRLSPSSEALKLGYFFNAATTAFIMKTSGVTLTSLCSSASFLRNKSISVISASSFWVTCGIIAQLRARFAPEIFLMRDKGKDSIAPYLAKSTCGQGIKFKPEPAPELATPETKAALTNCCTSAFEIRPPRSLPLIFDKSTPSSRANTLTEGLA